MSEFPSVDESFDRLHRAGWSVGTFATPSQRYDCWAAGQN